MKKLFVILVILILIIILALGYFGFVPGVSALFGSNQPRDLGVEYTIEDYQQAKVKAPVEIIVSEGDVAPEKSLIMAGSVDVDSSLTSAELTSILGEEENNWRYNPITDFQVLIGEDGSAQVSGMMHFDRLEGYLGATGGSYSDVQKVLKYFKLVPDAIPFYVSSTATVTNNRAFLGIGKAELGRIPVPQNLLDNNISEINNFVSDVLAGYDEVFVESMTLDEGELRFKGSLPESIESYR